MDYTKKLPNENMHLEYKSSKRALSKDIWESISAFENTDGGVIILGVDEVKSQSDTQFEITGVLDAQVILDNFWSTLNNDKISYSTVHNKDVTVIKHGDKSIIEIRVNEAPTNKKPIYLNNNINTTFVRKGSVDIKAKEEDLQVLLRDSRDDLDTRVLRNYWINDLEELDILAYKKLMTARPQYSKYKNYDDEQFLERIGVIAKDYENDGRKGITAGGLLFFGKNNAILHSFPNFQLDYFDKSNPLVRWTKRISSVEDDLNIFSFFDQVTKAINTTIPDPFQLNEQLNRIDTGGSLAVALREAIINMLMHADYYGDSPVKATSYINYYEFLNPGKMKIPAEEFFTTNTSKTRNPVISKLFIQIGNGERAGQGGEKIYEAAAINNFRLPKIVTSLNETKLEVWKVDYANSFLGEEIDSRERTILKTIVSNSKHSLSHKQIEEETKLSRSIVSRSLKVMLDKKIIVKEGSARSTRYTIPSSDEQMMANLQMMPNLIRDILRAQSNSK